MTQATKFLSIDDFLTLLQGVKPSGKDKHGDPCWKAFCPAHGDNDPSLSVILTKNGTKIKLTCFAGCQDTDILESLGLKVSQLWIHDPSKPTRSRPGKGDAPRERVCDYIYRDEKGQRLFRKIRWKPKWFTQERAEGEGGWVGGEGCMKDVRKVLWDLPRVIAASDILWLEGEKDCIAASEKLGVVATTVSEGAGVLNDKTWVPEYTETVRGKHVVIVPDNDDTGINHALLIARKIDGVAASVKILLLPVGPKQDLSDWLDTHSADEWPQLLESAADYTAKLAGGLAAICGKPLPAPKAKDADGDGASGDGKVAVRDMIMPARDTDTGNAERLVRLHGDKIRYSFERNSWYVWTGKVWARDLGAKINALAKDTVLNIYREAADEADDKARKVLVDHARRSESDARIKAMLSRAESEPGIPITVADMDSDPWLLNCQNGVLDLRTGELLTHDPIYLMTRITATDYDPDAPCPLWRNFMKWATGGDADLEAYIQRALGYSLVGDTSEQVMFFAFGLGSNGKTVLTSTFYTMMGDYAGKVQADDLMVADRNLRGRATEGLANLLGRRYTIGSEIRDGRKLDVGAIKDWTGCDPVTARHLYEREFTFRPTCTLWLYGNKRPAIHDTTLAVWRRMKLIPFTQTVADKDRDRNLAAKMERDELPGILAWAVMGCMEWQARGLGDPEVVTAATQDYRAAEDILGEWIAECCYLDDPAAAILKADLKQSYSDWCHTNHYDEVKRNTFKGSLEERGITSFRGTGSKHYWKGIRLLTPDEITARAKADAEAEAAKVTKVTKVTNSDATQPEMSATAHEGKVTEVTKVTYSDLTSHVRTDTTKIVANTPSSVTNVTDSAAMDSFVCPVCKGNSCWQRSDGVVLCARCHPAPRRKGAK